MRWAVVKLIISIISQFKSNSVEWTLQLSHQSVVLIQLNLESSLMGHSILHRPSIKDDGLKSKLSINSWQKSNRQIKLITKFYPKIPSLSHHYSNRQLKKKITMSTTTVSSPEVASSPLPSIVFHSRWDPDRSSDSNLSHSLVFFSFYQRRQQATATQTAETQRIRPCPCRMAPIGEPIWLFNRLEKSQEISNEIWEWERESEKKKKKKRKKERKQYNKINRRVVLYWPQWRHYFA